MNFPLFSFLNFSSSFLNRYLLADFDFRSKEFQSEEWKLFFATLIETIYESMTVVETILSNSSPEGNIPDSFRGFFFFTFIYFSIFHHFFFFFSWKITKMIKMTIFFKNTQENLDQKLKLFIVVVGEQWELLRNLFLFLYYYFHLYPNN